MKAVVCEIVVYCLKIQLENDSLPSIDDPLSVADSIST